MALRATFAAHPERAGAVGPFAPLPNEPFAPLPNEPFAPLPNEPLAPLPKEVGGKCQAVPDEHRPPGVGAARRGTPPSVVVHVRSA